MKILLPFFFSMIFLVSSSDVNAQSNTIKFDALKNNELFWLRQYDIDLFYKDVLQAKLAKNIKSVFQQREIERQKRAQIATYGVIGFAGLAAGLANANTSFTSQGVNSILSAMGVISTGIAFKKFFERKSATKELEQRIRLCKAQYDLHNKP